VVFFEKRDAMEKAEKTAGLILPQAGTQTRNNVTAGTTVAPVWNWSARQLNRYPLLFTFARY